MEEKRYTIDEAIELYDAERFDESLEAFRQHRKDPVAQYYLGLHYYEGYGVEKDMEQAMYWFKKSSRRGNLDAKYMLLCCEGNTTDCCKG